MLDNYFKTKFEECRRSFKDFCSNTSIHGLKYVVRDGIHWLQRIAWMLVFLAGLIFSGWFCAQMWQKWEDSPVLMSLETIRYPHKNIPFPAVSICNVNKVSKRKLEAMLAADQRLGKVGYEAVQRTLRYMTRLDRAVHQEEDLARLSSLYRKANVTSRDLFELLKKTAPTCDEMIIDCNWQDKNDVKTCHDYLSFLPTDDGLCCVFNGANYSDPDLGISSKSHEPLRVSGNGYRKGLSVVLDTSVDDYGVLNGNYFDGFKVLIHASQKFPDVADRGFALSPGFEVFAGVKGSSSDTAAEVTNKIRPEKRNCRAEGEGSSLSYFPRYSQSGCIIECATDVIQKTLQCRPYFLRWQVRRRGLHRNWTNTKNRRVGLPLCDMEIYPNISKIYENIRSDPETGGCDCPPPCTEEWYEPEISYATFPGRGFHLSRTFQRLATRLNLSANDVHTNSYIKTNVALLHVYYKDRTGVRYKTDIRFDTNDFISAMGGLLSLGVGLSFISVLELVYIFSKNIWRFFPSINGSRGSFSIPP